MLELTQQNNLTPLFDLCRQAFPYLDGKLEIENGSQVVPLPSLDNQQNLTWLLGTEQDGLIIKSLLQDLHQLSPDAGKTYYMTRAWELLCWQPMYISFIAIYGLKKLPDYSHFKQKYQHSSVYQFAFNDDYFLEAPIDQLITTASQQLKVLFEHYRQQLDLLTPCRLGYTNRLTADLILSILIKVSELTPDFNQENAIQHAQIWLKAMGLPLHLINTLQLNKHGMLTHARTSCCLTYKANNDTCLNCPKKHRLQQTRKKQS